MSAVGFTVIGQCHHSSFRKEVSKERDLTILVRSKMLEMGEVDLVVRFGPVVCHICKYEERLNNIIAKSDLVWWRRFTFGSGGSIIEDVRG